MQAKLCQQALAPWSCCRHHTRHPQHKPSHLQHIKQQWTRPACSQGVLHHFRQHTEADTSCAAAYSRRSMLLAGLAVVGVASLPVGSSQAVQGYTAGRIPGLTQQPDENGFYTYIRPEGKQGGHGVGWSELPRYSFQVPSGWAETPVSIADLGGTEIDLRFASKEQGSLEVVVAPVMRFKDIDFNQSVKIEEIAPPDRLIDGFALEIFGSPLQEGDVKEQSVEEHNGWTFYNWEVKPSGSSSPYHLVSATAVKNRVILLAINANARQWRRSADLLRHMWKSLRVVST